MFHKATVTCTCQTAVACSLVHLEPARNGAGKPIQDGLVVGSNHIMLPLAVIMLWDRAQCACFVAWEQVAQQSNKQEHLLVGAWWEGVLEDV